MLSKGVHPAIEDKHCPWRSAFEIIGDQEFVRDSQRAGFSLELRPGSITGREEDGQRVEPNEQSTRSEIPRDLDRLGMYPKIMCKRVCLAPAPNPDLWRDLVGMEVTLIQGPDHLQPIDLLRDVQVRKHFTNDFKLWSPQPVVEPMLNEHPQCSARETIVNECLIGQAGYHLGAPSLQQIKSDKAIVPVLINNAN